MRMPLVRTSPTNPEISNVTEAKWVAGASYRHTIRGSFSVLARGPGWIGSESRGQNLVPACSRSTIFRSINTSHWSKGRITGGKESDWRCGLPGRTFRSETPEALLKQLLLVIEKSN